MPSLIRGWESAARVAGLVVFKVRPSLHYLHPDPSRIALIFATSYMSRNRREHRIAKPPTTTECRLRHPSTLEPSFRNNCTPWRSIPELRKMEDIRLRSGSYISCGRFMHTHFANGDYSAGKIVPELTSLAPERIALQSLISSSSIFITARPSLPSCEASGWNDVIRRWDLSSVGSMKRALLRRWRMNAMKCCRLLCRRWRTVYMK